jgi:hypothetical protein
VPCRPVSRPPFDRNVQVPRNDLAMISLAWLRCLRVADGDAGQAGRPLLSRPKPCAPAALRTLRESGRSTANRARQARPSPCPERHGSSAVRPTRSQGLASRNGPHACSVRKRFSTPRSARRLSATNRGLLPGTPASTRTGFPPAGLDQLSERHTRQCYGGRRSLSHKFDSSPSARTVISHCIRGWSRRHEILGRCSRLDQWQAK